MRNLLFFFFLPDLDRRLGRCCCCPEDESSLEQERDASRDNSSELLDVVVSVSFEEGLDSTVDASCASSSSSNGGGDTLATTDADGLLLVLRGDKDPRGVTASCAGDRKEVILLQ